ncbi:hypothetical protein R1T16_16220 [Flavobacterium sp. DG1-102-2]|uniref:hypothetical protein n=1 Tax=Flavobacterium sp. DG1-102-2 TaxID=3081663 RepID=UPI00294A930C|nr:hypothetical protein [Flavobacterium sp. DG1-102-2]MDV6169985.1 hypothetical protein [Flavobacterium sp. DG1-102-2]
MKKLLFTLVFIIPFTAGAQNKKKPAAHFEWENNTTLTKFLEENDVEINIKDLATLDYIGSWAYFNNNNFIQVPSAIFFNREGYRIAKDFVGEKCSQTIKDMDKIDTYKVNKDENINDWVSKYMAFPFTTEPVFGEPFDAYVIIFYCKCLNSYDDVNATSFRWYKSLKNNNKVKVKVILLNLDIQDTWELNDEQKKAIGLQ